MKAIIVGAGIAGLVTARQLGLAGWEIDILEKSAAPRPDGYMMDFFGPGVEAAEQIGLYTRLAAVAYDIKAVDYVDLAGRRTCSISYSRFSRLAGGKVLSLLRPDMERIALDALLEDVPAEKVRIRYGARVTDAGTNDEGAFVHVQGPSPGTFGADLLVGADGIHSQVRASIFGVESIYLHPLGIRAAAFIVEDADLHARVGSRFVLTDTIDRMAGLYGLFDNKIAVLLVYRDGANEKTSKGGPRSGRERLRQEFDGMGGTLTRLLDLCPEDPYDDIAAQIVIPSWQKGQAVLVGDACGAVSLLAGQGGSLAIAGAALLAELLSTASSATDIHACLAQFEQRWQPVIGIAQASGRRAASSFLPRNRFQRLLRRWVIRATHVPGIDRLVARQILRGIAK